jgi:hypothetical protein
MFPACSRRTSLYVKYGRAEISYEAKNSVLESMVLLNFLFRSLLKYTRRMQSYVA